MKTIYFSGCSITEGHGFENKSNDERIYPHLVCSSTNSKCINDAEGGSSNLKIFTKTAKAIVDEKADVYVVQWSALHRHWLYPKPDDALYIGSQKDSFTKQFQLRNHDYGNLLSVIDYTRILEYMCKKQQTRILFVNGLVTWSNNPLDEYYDNLTLGYNKHVKQQLIDQIFNNIDLVDMTLWINPWINVYESKVDDAPLDSHPGPKTHKLLADLIIEKL